MKAYIAIKFYSDHRNRDLIMSLKKALDNFGYESICMASDIENFGEKEFNSRELMITTFKLIDECDFVIIEASEKGMGIGIEAGYSYAKGKPIIVLAKEGIDISNTLSGIAHKIYHYKNPKDIINPLGVI